MINFNWKDNRDDLKSLYISYFRWLRLVTSDKDKKIYKYLGKQLKKLTSDDMSDEDLDNYFDINYLEWLNNMLQFIDSISRKCIDDLICKENECIVCIGDIQLIELLKHIQQSDYKKGDDETSLHFCDYQMQFYKFYVKYYLNNRSELLEQLRTNELKRLIVNLDYDSMKGIAQNWKVTSNTEPFMEFLEMTEYPKPAFKKKKKKNRNNTKADDSDYDTDGDLMSADKKKARKRRELSRLWREKHKQRDIEREVRNQGRRSLFDTLEDFSGMEDMMDGLNESKELFDDFQKMFDEESSDVTAPLKRLFEQIMGEVESSELLSGLKEQFELLRDTEPNQAIKKLISIVKNLMSNKESIMEITRVMKIILKHIATAVKNDDLNLNQIQSKFGDIREKLTGNDGIKKIFKSKFFKQIMKKLNLDISDSENPIEDLIEKFFDKIKPTESTESTENEDRKMTAEEKDAENQDAPDLISGLMNSMGDVDGSIGDIMKQMQDLSNMISQKNTEATGEATGEATEKEKSTEATDNPMFGQLAEAMESVKEMCSELNNLNIEENILKQDLDEMNEDMDIISNAFNFNTSDEPEPKSEPTNEPESEPTNEPEPTKLDHETNQN